jgi:preprotein translocase, SecE subunit, bacterial
MIERIKLYLSETRTELKKVTWPSRQDLIDSTKVVIVATLIMTVFVGIVDQVLSRIIKLVFG